MKSLLPLSIFALLLTLLSSCVRYEVRRESEEIAQFLEHFPKQWDGTLEVTDSLRYAETDSLGMPVGIKISQDIETKNWTLVAHKANGEHLRFPILEVAKERSKTYFKIQEKEREAIVRHEPDKFDSTRFFWSGDKRSAIFPGASPLSYTLPAYSASLPRVFQADTGLVVLGESITPQHTTELPAARSPDASLIWQAYQGSLGEGRPFRAFVLEENGKVTRGEYLYERYWQNLSLQRQNDEQLRESPAHALNQTTGYFKTQGQGMRNGEWLDSEQNPQLSFTSTLLPLSYALAHQSKDSLDLSALEFPVLQSVNGDKVSLFQEALQSTLHELFGLVKAQDILTYRVLFLSEKYIFLQLEVWRDGLLIAARTLNYDLEANSALSLQDIFNAGNGFVQRAGKLAHNFAAQHGFSITSPALSLFTPYGRNLRLLAKTPEGSLRPVYLPMQDLEEFISQRLRLE